jgi:hypothetical protein
MGVNFLGIEFLSYPGAELEDDSWRVPTFLEVSSLFNFSKRVELKENLPPIIFWLDHDLIQIKLGLCLLRKLDFSDQLNLILEIYFLLGI